jgi:hypothetical protein
MPFSSSQKIIQWAFRIVRVSGDGAVIGFSLDGVDDIPPYQE